MSRHIVYEIVVEVLSGLPVKSLLRFKSVSKEWHSIITDPKFVSLQLNRSCQRPGAITAFLTPDDTPSFHSINHQASVQEITDLAWTDPDTGTSYTNFKIIGSCNGFLFINSDCDWFLWNPSTRSVMQVKSLMFRIHDFALHGFGYNSHDDDYKAVVGHTTGYTETIRADVYSLKSNSWKTIWNIPFRTNHSGLGTLVNGFPHWKIAYGFALDGYKIFCLDLGEDEFKEVPQPDIFRIGWGYEWQLFEFKDTLSVLGSCRGNYPREAEVWSMKEYGVKDSWSKMFVVPYVGQIGGSISNHYGGWYFVGSGEFAAKIVWGRVLIICKLEEGKHEVVFSSDSIQLVPYVESLLSPDDDEEEEEQEEEEW